MSTDIDSVGGVYWHDAPLPPRIHSCKPQTTGWIVFDKVERCACGAIRNPRFGGAWLNKNERRAWGEGESVETELRIAGKDRMFSTYIACRKLYIACAHLWQIMVAPVGRALERLLG